MEIFDQLTPHQWEYFAGYYFSSLGYDILHQPSVGQDGGKDLLVRLGNVTSLVSCKHYSKSKRLVLASDEDSVSDRLIQHGAQQFIGFYSTKGSCSLRDSLNLDGVDYLLFEGEAIFRNMNIVSYSVHQSLFTLVKFYKAKSFERPYRALLCKCGCGKDLLAYDNASNSLICLAVGGEGLEVVWGVQSHIDSFVVDVIAPFNVASCFSLVLLNEAIDKHEQIIEGVELVSEEFDREYCFLIEALHQMVESVD